MKFVLGLGNQATIENSLPLTREVAKLGLHGVSIAEHIGLSVNDVFAMVCLLAEETGGDICFLANSVNQFSRHPISIAMAATTAAQGSNGKFILGLGTGAGDSLKKMGIDESRSLSRLKEVILITRGLIEGREVAFDGEFFSLETTKLQNAGKYRIPLFVPAIRDHAILVAAEHGDGIFLSNCSSTAFVEYVIKKISETNKARRDFGFAAPLTYIPTEDRQQGLWSAKMAIMRYLSIPGIGEVLLERTGIDPTIVARIRQGKMSISDQIADQLTVIGGMNGLEKRIEEFDRVGVTHLLVTSPTDPTKALGDLGKLHRSFD